MSQDYLEKAIDENGCQVYQIEPKDGAEVVRFVVSTKETRAICNDPFVAGVEYTEYLKSACRQALSVLKKHGTLSLIEKETTVLHILRGGLNFGLREAISQAYGWNNHSSAFISAQRMREPDAPDQWYISEHSYRKVYLPKISSIVFGDVVATGTSLEYALKQILEQLAQQGSEVRSFVFFTIGGSRSEELLEEIDAFCRKYFKNYEGSVVIYFEGRFTVASDTTRLSIKLTGTDLVRVDSLMAPEFVTSQYENPAYPLERCTIYDAGSRAFYVQEYYEDVLDYWKQTLALAKNGMKFKDFLWERMPEVSSEHFENASLETIASQQVQRIEKVLHSIE